MFDNHFVKGDGVTTAFLTLRSALALHGPRADRPAFLKLDVEGFEFQLVDQLLALRSVAAAQLLPHSCPGPPMPRCWCIKPNSWQARGCRVCRRGVEGVRAG